MLETLSLLVPLVATLLATSSADPAPPAPGTTTATAEAPFPRTYKRVGLDFRAVTYRGHNREFSELGLAFDFATNFDHDGTLFYDFGFAFGLGGTNQRLAVLHVQSVTDVGAAFKLDSVGTTPSILTLNLAVFARLRVGYSVFHTRVFGVDDVSDYLNIECEIGVGLEFAGVFIAPAFLFGIHSGISSSSSGGYPPNLVVHGLSLSIGAHFP